jgi:hypothetical protein
MGTIGQPWLFEPDADALVDLLKRVVRDRDGARVIGMTASDHIREHFTWVRTVETLEQRFRAFTGDETGQEFDDASGERGALAGTLAGAFGVMGSRLSRLTPSARRGSP